MIEVGEQLNGVQRAVGTRVLEAGQVRVVTVSQVYDATLQELWDACTNAERIPRWFLPVSGDLRLGGHYQLEGNAGGTIERCDPPHAFQATWEYGGNVTWIELRLAAEPAGGTRFVLDHLIPVDADPPWDQFGPGAVGIGWDMALLGLANHLATGRAIDPAESATWAISDAARQFMTGSSTRWYEADVAGGADSAAARASADRTIAAYTAPPPDSSADPSATSPSS